MGLASRVVFGATTSQIRHGEHNNTIKVPIPITRVEGGRFVIGKSFSMFSAMTAT